MPHDRLTLKDFIQRSAKLTWMRMQAEMSNDIDRIHEGNGNFDNTTILRLITFLKNPEPPLLYYYGAKWKIDQFARYGAIRMAPNFTRNDQRQLNIPGRGFFPEGAYAFTVPPWSDEHSKTLLTKAAYGEAMIGHPHVSFECCIAFIPDLYHWIPSGFYNYPDTSEIMHYCMQPGRSPDKVIRILFQIPGQSSQDANSLQIRIVYSGPTFLSS
ncbi:hypothetical protein [Pandoraea sp. NPDC090278]|uniref:hypothetical protein n=1 Tax=Pandoraea sp. NPDC090278 TaxID=3364391 RepID=UPI00383A12BA